MISHCVCFFFFLFLVPAIISRFWIFISFIVAFSALHSHTIAFCAYVHDLGKLNSAFFFFFSFVCVSRAHLIFVGVRLMFGLVVGRNITQIHTVLSTLAERNINPNSHSLPFHFCRSFRVIRTVYIPTGN